MEIECTVKRLSRCGKLFELGSHVNLFLKAFKCLKYVNLYVAGAWYNSNLGMYILKNRVGLKIIEIKKRLWFNIG